MAGVEIQRDGAKVTWRQCLGWPSPHLVSAEVDHGYTVYIVFRVGNGRYRIPHRNLHKRNRYEVGMELSIFDKPQVRVERVVQQALI
jgi:hypothetical protein